MRVALSTKYLRISVFSGARTRNLSAIILIAAYARFLVATGLFVYYSDAWCAATGQRGQARRLHQAPTTNPTGSQCPAALWSADEDTTMKTLNGLDATFFYLETPAMPMHVGSLNLCELPAGHKGSFHKAVTKHMALRMHLAPVLSPPAVGQG